MLMAAGTGTSSHPQPHSFSLCKGVKVKMSLLPLIREEVMPKAPAAGEVAEWEEFPHYKEATLLHWGGVAGSSQDAHPLGNSPLKSGDHTPAQGQRLIPELSGPGIARPGTCPKLKGQPEGKTVKRVWAAASLCGPF